MLLRNRTIFCTGHLQGHVKDYNTKNLLAVVKHTKKGAKCFYSGRFCSRKNKINVSINPKNKYPMKIRVGSPFNKKSWKCFSISSAEELIAYIFLHEFSHFLDHQSDIPLRCKQTKADLFALGKLGKL